MRPIGIRTLAAYVGGFSVLVGLLTLVMLGGNAVEPKRQTAQFTTTAQPIPVADRRH